MENDGIFEVVSDEESINSEVRPKEPLKYHMEECREVESLDEIIDSYGWGFAQVLVVLFVGFFNVVIASELTIFSFLLPILKEEWGVTSFEISLIGTFTFFGLFLGSVFFGYLSDLFGRKDIICICTIIIMFCGSLSSLCWNHYLFGVLEFFIGVHVGGGAVLIWQYYVEFLPTRLRGFLLINMQFFWTIGVIWNCLLSWLFLTSFNRFNWNFLVLVTTFPCVLVIAMVPCLPRSPRFLIVRNKPKDLQVSIDWIQRMNSICCWNWKKNKFSYDVNKIIQNSTNTSQVAKSSSRFRLRYLCNCKTAFMFISIIIFYVFAYFGYYGVTLSSPNFFSGVKNMQYFGTLLITFAEFPGVFSASIALSVIGRKNTLTVYLLLSSLSLALLLIPHEVFFLQVIFGFLARGSIIGASSTTWVLAQESLPTRVRAFGSGVGNGLGNFVTCLTPIIVNVYSGNNAFIPKIICAILTCCGGILCLFYPYESKGKKLKDFA